MHIELLTEVSPRSSMRLGRHHVTDPRSLEFTVEKTLQRVPIVPSSHPCPTDFPILDQGNLGSCTGNAATEALAALNGANWRTVALDGKTIAADPEAFAVDVYHDETEIDGLGGPYPPNDRGSSGLAACKVLKAAGLIKSYVWATTVHEFAELLQHGGVIVGMPWYNAFFDPATNGSIDSSPNWKSSGLAGGHELYFDSLEVWPVDPNEAVLRFRQSWGPNWGDLGYGRMKMSTYSALRHQIDIKQFRSGS